LPDGLLADTNNIWQLARGDVRVADENGAAGPSRRPRRSSDEIRRRLLEAANAEFRARGYGGATTAAIARRAGVAEMQLFRVFPRKGEAILAPLELHVQRFREDQQPISLGGDSLAMGLAYIAELRSFLGEQAPLLHSLFDAETYSTVDPGEKAAIRCGVQRFFDECAAALAARLGGSGGEDVGLLARIMHGTLLGCLTYDGWLFAGQQDRGAIDAAILRFMALGVGFRVD
jgi:AcrR family transcriptional regulator